MGRYHWRTASGLCIAALMGLPLTRPSAQGVGRLTASPAQSASKVAAVINTYCAGCHNGSNRSVSGARLARFDPDRIASTQGVWARAYRQLQAGTMPPVGSPRPDRTTYDAVLLSIEEALGVNAGPAASANSHEIAVRLATLLWNSAPDVALTEHANRSGLSDPVILKGQVQRMLADDRAQAFVSRFLFPWLDLDKLAAVDPDPAHFPDYTVSLRDALARETELFLLSQLRDDRDPLDLWSAGYTFLNEQLARHYDVPNVTGPAFRRVPSEPARAGLLGHGSVFLVASHLTTSGKRGIDAGFTTPAARAKWVRLHFLGASLPTTFPGAEPVKRERPITPQTRALPAEPCRNCHRNFFPLGYALENFDPLGRWRTHDQAGPVDTSGTFVDGTPTDGVIELRKAMLKYPAAFRTTLTEQLLIYAWGGDVPAVGTPETLIRTRQILRTASSPRWSDLITAVVQAKAQ